MSDERGVTRYDPNGGSVAPPKESDNFLSAILAAAKDPQVDAMKVKTLADLAVSLQDRERETEFNRDLNAAIMEMPIITKDGRIVIRKPGEPDREQGRFARLEDIDRVVRPVAARHNLAYSWDVGDSGSGPVVAIILTHVNGYQVQSSGMKMPLDTSGGKNNVQGAGSAVTYGKRYTLCARFNIQTEGSDDDGNLGRGAVVTLTNEREQLVLSEAKAAHEQGRYPEYFSGLGPKDRAWLIQSGQHAGFGGQVALPAARAKPTQSESTPPPPPPPPPPAADPPAKKRTSPREWVDAFKRDVTACAKLDDLDLYMDEARDSLLKLKTSNEALWQETQDAYAARKAAIEEGRLV